MRAAFLDPILPQVVKEGESKKAALILMKNSHFDRSLRYVFSKIKSVTNCQMLFLAILPESWTNGVASRCKSSGGCSWFVRRKVLLSTRRRSPRRSGRMWRPPPSSKRRKCLPGRGSGQFYSGFFVKKEIMKLMTSHRGYLPFLPVTPTSPSQTLAEL